MEVTVLQSPQPPAPRPGYKRGPSIRIGRITHIFDYIPPFTLRDIFGITAYCCGRCFRKLGDNPFGSRAGQMIPGAPKGSTCAFCGHQAWPYGV